MPQIYLILTNMSLWFVGWTLVSLPHLTLPHVNNSIEPPKMKKAVIGILILSNLSTRAIGQDYFEHEHECPPRDVWLRDYFKVLNCTAEERCRYEALCCGGAWRGTETLGCACVDPFQQWSGRCHLTAHYLTTFKKWVATTKFQPLSCGGT